MLFNKKLLLFISVCLIFFNYFPQLEAQELRPITLSGLDFNAFFIWKDEKYFSFICSPGPGVVYGEIISSIEWRGDNCIWFFMQVPGMQQWVLRNVGSDMCIYPSQGSPINARQAPCLISLNQYTGPSAFYINMNRLSNNLVIFSSAIYGTIYSPPSCSVGGECNHGEYGNECDAIIPCYYPNSLTYLGQPSDLNYILYNWAATGTLISQNLGSFASGRIIVNNTGISTSSTQSLTFGYSEVISTEISLSDLISDEFGAEVGTTIIGVELKGTYKHSKTSSTTKTFTKSYSADLSASINCEADPNLIVGCLASYQKNQKIQAFNVSVKRLLWANKRNREIVALPDFTIPVNVVNTASQNLQVNVLKCSIQDTLCLSLLQNS